MTATVPAAVGDTGASGAGGSGSGSGLAGSDHEVEYSPSKSLLARVPRSVWPLLAFLVLFGVILLQFNFSELTQIPEFITAITSAQINVFGFSMAAVLPLGLVLMVVLQLVLSYTGWGRSLFLVGAAPETARLAGLPVDRIRITGYVISGMLAAFAGMVIVGYFQQASATMGDSYLLSSVAAVVVGGASIFGGRGSVVGTVGGALVLGQVATLVTVLNLGSNVQQLIYGAIILVVISLYGRKRG